MSGRGMNAQIVRAFRREGYRAWIDGGCARVDWGYCKPNVRWRTDDYAAQIRWGWGDLSFSLRHVNHESRRARPVSRPIRGVYRRGVCG